MWIVRTEGFAIIKQAYVNVSTDYMGLHVMILTHKLRIYIGTRVDKNWISNSIIMPKSKCCNLMNCYI